MHVDLSSKPRAIRRKPRDPARLPIDYGRFMQADPIGYEGGMNLYGYVLNDPVNLTDPSGLQDSGQNVVVTGNPLFRPQNAPSRNFRNFGPIPSGSLGLQEPDFLSRKLDKECEAGATDPENCHIVVTGRRPSIRTRIRWSVIQGLDSLAEVLEPPEGRRDGETYLQCVRRISGPALGLTTVAGGTAAMGWPSRSLYPRTGFGGGGEGTSIMSTITRGVLGNRSVGFRALGSGNLGGMAGRAISRTNLYGGAAGLGFGAGASIGALIRCQ